MFNLLVSQLKFFSKDERVLHIMWAALHTRKYELSPHEFHRLRKMLQRRIKALPFRKLEWSVYVRPCETWY